MNTRIRFVLILLFLVIGVVLHVKMGISSAWYLYLAAIIILVSHFLFGSVWAAFAMLRKGKIPEAELLIDQIKRPQYLMKQNKAYYHFVKGMIALQKEDLEPGKNQLKQALDIGLKTSNDNALTALNIAHIYYKQNMIAPCQDFLKKSKSYNPNDLMIKEKIGELEKVLATPYN